MAYSESQLETWSHQGSKAQSASTYDTVRSVLEDRSAPYAAQNFETFLQGSYGNDTNIYADSDVDIVICLTSIFYHNLDALGEAQRNLYESNRTPATYSWRQFRNEVLAWLRSKFGSAVVDGEKAIFVRGEGNRRDADILVCAEHRRYFSYENYYEARFATGVIFWSSSGTEIVNFPKQHHDNCASKHQNAYFRFKPNVRVLKNYRNSVVDSGKLAEGVAPSYFVEGLLWNMPNVKFDAAYSTTMNNFLQWASTVDVSSLTCPNELYYLVRDNSPVCWSKANFKAYLDAMQSDW